MNPTESHILEALMYFLAGSHNHARTLVPQEKEPGSTGSVPDSGAKWRESLARYDPDSHLWKTPQCLLFGDSTESLRILPRWGSMRNGELFRRRTPGRLTSGKESGYWPTPVSYDATPGGPGNHYNGLGKMAKHLWPTPRKSEYKGSGPKGCKAQKHMLDRNYLCAVVEEIHGGTPTRRTWDTPSCADAHPRALNRNRGFIGNGQKHLQAQAYNILKSENHGQLNPNWVEWLMGWPIEWTALKPLETDRFRQWLDSHGKY